MPDLQYSPGPFDPINHFHTFVGLGFLDVHVEMTVDPAQNVTSKIWAQSIGDVNLPVRPGDVISGSLCLNTNPAGTAAYFLANETTAQTISFGGRHRVPPGRHHQRGRHSHRGPQPAPPPSSHHWPASGSSTSTRSAPIQRAGTRSLTSGDAITMVDQNGKTLARPVRLTDFTFKAVFVVA